MGVKLVIDLLAGHNLEILYSTAELSMLSLRTKLFDQNLILTPSFIFSFIMVLGIGSIPDAVLASLKSHKQLGVHTEMFSDGIVDLVEAGVITNAHKIIHQGKIVTGFVVGTKRVFDFIHNNPFVG